EAERHRSELHRGDHGSVPDRVPALEPADQHDEARADPEEERSNPGHAQPARRRQPPPAAGRRSRSSVLGLRLGLVEADDRLPHWGPPEREFTSAARFCFGSELKVSGITPFGYPGAT